MDFQYLQIRLCIYKNYYPITLNHMYCNQYTYFTQLNYKKDMNNDIYCKLLAVQNNLTNKRIDYVIKPEIIFDHMINIHL